MRQNRRFEPSGEVGYQGDRSFWSPYAPNGHNGIHPDDVANINGGFLTAPAPFATGRGSGYTRTITFDHPVAQVSLYVADADSHNPLVVHAYDGEGVEVATVDLPDPTYDGRAILVDLTAASMVRRVTLEGADALGIDNLRFAHSKFECKDGGWEALGFRNQGQCVRFVETGKDSR